MAPTLNKLSQRLVKKTEVDAVLAAGGARGLWVGLENLERQVDENVEPAGEQIRVPGRII
jgi:hypothetical protein